MSGRANKKEIYVGIDLNDRGALVSFYTPDMVEPETETAGGEEQFIFPAAVLRTDTGKLFYGEEAVRRKNDPGVEYHDNLVSLALQDETPKNREYLLLFLKRLLAFRKGYVQSEEIPYYLSITLPKLDSKIVELFSWIRKSLELPQSFFKLTDYRESFFDYTILQDRSIWKNDTILFDYSTENIILYDMTISGKLHPLDAKVDTRTYSVPAAVHADNEQKDAFFSQIVREVFKNRMVSGVYLIGKGFDGRWLDQSINEFGTNKRIFIGKNLFTRGACLGFYREKEELVNNIRFVCDYKIPSELSLCVLMNQHITYQPITLAGQNWFDSIFECDLLYNGRNTLEIWLRQPEKGQQPAVQLTLEDFPVRDPKSMRLHLTARPENERMLSIVIRDDGFGGLYATTGKSWTFSVPLMPEVFEESAIENAPDTLFLLCTGARAKEPYLLKPDELPIYTLEELCYYMKEHLFLLGEDSFEKDMISWIRKQIGMPALAGKLENHVNKSEVPYPAAYDMFDSSGIYSREEMGSIRDTIRVLENQTPIEKKKQRADYLLSHDQNREALYIYLELLDDHNLNKMDPSLHAEICYHAGVVYTRYFLYREAMQQFESAYSFEPSGKICRAYYMARELMLLREPKERVPQSILPIEEETLESIRDDMKHMRAQIADEFAKRDAETVAPSEQTGTKQILSVDSLALSEQWLGEYERSLR